MSNAALRTANPPIDAMPVTISNTGNTHTTARPRGGPIS